MADKHFCDLTWRIENFNCCWHLNSSNLQSEPFVFTPDDQTSWNLAIFPNRLSQSTTITIYLKRNNSHQEINDPGTEDSNKSDTNSVEDVKLKYEFSIWSRTYNKWRFICNQTPIKRHNEAWEMGYIWNHWLENDTQDLLPGNVLYVRFKITSLEDKFSKSTQVKLRTCLPVEKSTLSWDIEEFLSLKSDDSRSPEKEAEVGSLSIVLSYLTMYGEKGLKISLLSDEKTKPFSLKCNVTIHLTGESFVLSNDDISSLPFEKFYKPLKTWDNLVDESSKYLVEDTLSLDVELCIILHQLENFVQYVYIGSSDQPSLWYKTIDDVIENPPKNDLGSSQKPIEDTNDGSLQNEILSLYKNKVLTDCLIKVESQMFPAHATILSARSKVFHDMIMENENTDVLKIEDFNVDTIKKMLSYIYSDNTGELDFNSASNLYSASFKYKIKGLQKKTTEFLLRNVTVSNVGEILELADQYDDDFLTSKIVQFIAKNEKALMCSEDFKDFLMFNSTLAVQVFVALSEIRMNVK